MGTKLYVGGLPYSSTEQQLQELFSQQGSVTSVKIITDRYTGQSRGFGFVEMATSEAAQKAITALNGTQLDGRTLTVNEAKPQEKRTGAGDQGGRRRMGKTPTSPACDRDRKNLSSKPCPSSCDSARLSSRLHGGPPRSRGQRRTFRKGSQLIRPATLPPR